MDQRERRKKSRMEPVKGKKSRDTFPQEETDDLPVKPFNRKKLTLQLLTVAAVALAVAIGISIFFKVDTVSVSGLDKYSYESVRDASGILAGDSLLFFSRAEVSSRIMQKLPYVKSVRIGISLPGTVHIIIEEVSVFYGIQDVAGAWWLISAEGKVLEQIPAADVSAYTIMEGVKLQGPAPGAQAVASEQGESVTVTGADRLAAALEIATVLEKNEILGELSVIDVTALYDLQLWYGTDYQILLGDGQQLDWKIANVKASLPQILADYPPGVLDVSKIDETGRFPYTEFD